MAVLYEKAKPRDKPTDVITVLDIRKALKEETRDKYSKIFVPEFTFNAHRADAITIDIDRQKVVGFEIKVRRSDWKRDNKYHHYTKFCSQVYIVAEKHVVKKSEVKPPFGLIRPMRNEFGVVTLKQVKAAQQLQEGGALAWTWTYLRVLEFEMRRLADENEKLTLIKGY